MISVIFPVYNERENIPELLRELKDVLQNLGGDFEIIVVDDGSYDGSFELLRTFIGEIPQLKIVRFSRNFGQTAALAAGIAASKGDPVITIDGDLENDPRDIPSLVRELEGGYDIASGWRENRWRSRFLTRRVPSLAANWLISRISGLKLHDHGCTLKAYRRATLINIPLYGETHRLIAAYAHLRGSKISEIPVKYRERRFGVSNYGIGRTFHVILDLLLMRFLMRYMMRPIHFFGEIGFVSLGLGIAVGMGALWFKFVEDISLSRTPLPILSSLFIIVGVQLIAMGILAEIIMRTYYEAQHKLPYEIKDRVNF